jgi:GTPase
MINDVSYHPNIGVIISGILIEGVIKLKSKLFIGPIQNKFLDIEVNSIHKKQVPTDKLVAGESASLSISYKYTEKLNKYMRIVSANMFDRFVNKFSIEISNTEPNIANLKNGIKLMAFVNNTYDRIKLYNPTVKDDHIVYKAKFKPKQVRYLENNDSIVIRYSVKRNSDIVFGKVHQTSSTI